MNSNTSAIEHRTIQPYEDVVKKKTYDTEKSL